MKVLTSLGDVPTLGKDVFQVEMGSWKRGDLDGYEVTIPGTAGSARGTFVDMGNPHVVCVIEDAMSTLPRVEDLDLVTKPEVSPVLESDQNAEFVRVDEIDAAAGTGERPCVSMSAVAARRCPAAPVCAPPRSRCAPNRRRSLGHHRAGRHGAGGRHR